MRALEKREKARGRSVRSRSVRYSGTGVGWGKHGEKSEKYSHIMVTIALKEPLDVALAKLWLFWIPVVSTGFAIAKRLWTVNRLGGAD